AHVGHHVGPVPAVVQGLPFAMADELAHVRRGPALEGRPEGLYVGPAAGLVTVRPHHAVGLGVHHVLTDQARDHAGPAPLRVPVIDVLGDDRVMPVRLRQPAVVLPPLAVLVVPARVLVLEPLEVLVGHAVDPPVVRQPAGRARAACGSPRRPAPSAAWRSRWRCAATRRTAPSGTPSAAGSRRWRPPRPAWPRTACS